MRHILRLKELFATLPDARVAGRVLHPLPEVLFTALCAMLSDCEDYTDMGFFARSQLDWLRQFTPLKNGSPSHDVFRNVLLALPADTLLEILALWVGELSGRHIAIDGKVSRGAKDTTTGKSTLHLLRAWVSEAGLSVGQEACLEKSNELEALPRLLAKLQLHGATVTIDAMAGHPEVARLIQEAGAHYILALKANEKEAHQAIIAHFAALRPSQQEQLHAGGSWAEGCELSLACEQNRGRYERREVVVSRDLGGWPKSWKWAGLQSLICVRRESMRQRHSGEAPAVEMHYYLSSSSASAAELGRLIRNHWSVENQCHHLLDVTYHEDHCQVRDRNAAHNLTLLRELSAKVLKQSGLKGSVRSLRKRCALDPALRTQAVLPILQSFGA
ncbi:MAG: ISAs1 family transposase [Verrucomicrobiaceae bacterium]|nr:ISAs1 family transposase [Verrucomicrobiaceae bacterium]